MTWFGAVVVIYWALNLLSGAWVIGQGGIEITPGQAAWTMVFQALLLTGVFFIGTGLGVF